MKDLEFNKETVEDFVKNGMTEDGFVSKDYVESFIQEITSETKDIYGKLITVCYILLKNGWVIVDSSACVNPKNYSKEVGEDICKARAVKKVWEYLGFLAQTLELDNIG